MKKILVSILAVFIFFMTSSAAFAEAVMFNTKTLKFHGLGCRYAAICTVNCIKIEKKEAIKRGGIACKVCGGH